MDRPGRRDRRAKAALNMLLTITLLALPAFLGPLMRTFGRVIPLGFFAAGDRYMFRVLDQAGIYVLLALGLNIVVGYAGLLDLGYVAFYAVGAYTYALLASPQLGLHIPFWLVLPLAPLITAIFGVLLGAPTLRLRGDYLAIVTLGFGEVIRILLNNLDPLTNGPRGVINIDPATLDVTKLPPKSVEAAHLVLYPKFLHFLQDFPVTMASPVQYYYLILVLCVGAMFLCSRLQRSRTGRAWAAIREDEDVAQAMGINKTTIKLLAFAMGASTAGFSGVLFSGLQGFVSPESFVLVESINILAMVVLGGMGSIPGVVLGALLLTGLPEVLREYAQYRFTIFGLGLTLMVLVRPQGLWASRARPVDGGEGARGEETPGEGQRDLREAPTPVVEPMAKIRASRAGGEGAPSGDAALVLAGVTKSFGGLRAVRDVSFSVKHEQLIAVIGPNGAGKTTLFNLITGVYPPTSGALRFHGRALNGLRPDQVTALGVARTYQNIRPFKGMSVLDNVLVGTHNWTRATVLDAMLNTPRAAREERDSYRDARDLLDFVGIRSYESQMAMNLSYGDQRRLEIARALATHPTLLLLDEPAAGMNPAETAQLISLIKRVRDLGITVMLVEHDMKVVMQVSESIVVLDHGEKIAEGGPEDIQRNERVIEAYLGRVG
jgi:branched-chain amino acid transport system permease protein